MIETLLEDKLEPCAREIAHFLVATGAPIGSAWDGYYRDEDLIVLERREDDLVEFVRAANWQARMRLFNVHETEPDPDSIRFHPSIVISSEPKASASVVIENLRNDRPSEPYVWSKDFGTGASEANAVEASVVNETWGEAKVTAGIKVVEGEASAGFRTTLRAAWNRQTGLTRDERTGGRFSLVADPFSEVEGFLQWNEQTLQRRIEMDAKYDFGVQIGRRKKRKGNWHWTSGSPSTWDSLEHLIAVAEKRGSVHHAHYGTTPGTSFAPRRRRCSPPSNG